MKKMTQLLIEFPVRRPWVLFLATMVVVLLSLFPISSIEKHFSSRIWFAKGSAPIEQLDEFEQTFGGDNTIILGLKKEGGVLNASTLAQVDELTEKLWMVPFVVRVDSLTNYNYITVEDDDLAVTPLVENREGLLRDFMGFQNRLKDVPEVMDYLLTDDGQYTLIYVQMAPGSTNPDLMHEWVGDLDQTLDEYRAQGLEIHQLGNVTATVAFAQLAREDLAITLPLMFSFVILLLAWFFSSFAGVLIPLLVTGATIGTTFGLMGLLGIVYNNLLSAIPGVMMAICMANTIHLLHVFYQKKREGLSTEDSIRASMLKNLLPTILTSVTTCFSFLTLSNTELVPIADLGILCALGSLFAWLYTYTLLPTLLMLSPQFLLHSYRQIKKEVRGNYSHRLYPLRWPLTLAFLIIAVGASYLSLQNEVNSDPVLYFGKKTKVSQHYQGSLQHMKGSRSFDMVIDGGEEGAINNPEFLKLVQAFEKKIIDLPVVSNVRSILEPIRKVNQQIHEGKSERYGIPATAQEVAQNLLLYSLSLPEGRGIDNQVSADSRYLRLAVQWSVTTSKESVIQSEEIAQMGKDLGLDVNVRGQLPIFASVNDEVVSLFLTSLALVVVFVFIVILVVFRNLLLALLAMLPNLIPLLVGGGVMAYFGIYIDIGTSIVGAVCLGIAVDDTIHFVSHYLVNYRQLGSRRAAIDETIKTTGKAIVMTTAVLVLGFGSFVVADFVPNQYFGFLCAIVLSFAMMTDLVLLPVLLLLKKSEAVDKSHQ